MPQQTPDAESSVTRRLRERARSLWRLVIAVVVGFRGQELSLRAGNLTFVTVTSLVPLAAVILSLVHRFGGARIDPLVKRFMADILSPGGEQSVRAFFSATDSPIAGGLSFLVVMVSAGLLLRHLDASLNDIFSVRQRRPLLVSLGLYAGVLLLGPLFIMVSLLGSEGAKRLVHWLDLPFSAQAYGVGSAGAAVVVFSLLYKFAPHAPVPWKSAFTGGTVAGLAWELLRHLYGGIAGLIFNANMLYGSLGVAPLFLMWIYLGWLTVLSGARLAYAVEHAGFHHAFSELRAHPRSQELFASRIAELVTAAVLQGGPGLTTKVLALKLRMPEQRIIELARLLLDAGLLARSHAGIYAPARDPTALTLADVSAAVGGTAKRPLPESASRADQFESLAHRFALADDATIEKLSEITWQALATEPGSPASKP